jgi:hypothetical protein
MISFSDGLLFRFKIDSMTLIDLIVTGHSGQTIAFGIFISDNDRLA